MSKTGRTILGLAVATSLSVVACSDASRPLAPAPDAAGSVATEKNLVGTLVGILIAPVHRTTALANDVVWSFNAGPLGGYTSNSALGVSVSIPAGALDRNVKITVTAFKGKPIAYGFSPHLEFDKKVIITQSLKNTSCGLLSCLVSLKGAHFPGDRPTYSGGLAIVDEVVSGLLNSLTRKFSFGVDHFTGWIVASGNSSSFE